MPDRGGEHQAEGPPAGRRGWLGGAGPPRAAAKQCRAGLRGGDPAAGGRDQGPEEPADRQEAAAAAPAAARPGGRKGQTATPR